MKRTYDIFVDNGLYLASYYLNKDIKDITISDLSSSTDFFAEKIYSFISVEKYSKIPYMTFNNSALTQPSGKKNRQEAIRKQFDMFFENIGEDEYCTICGQRHVKAKIEPKSDYARALTRSVAVNMTSNTFYNFSNNLKLNNVCPVCIFLGMLSILNMRKLKKNILLYNSDSHAFMADYTKDKQIETANDIRILSPALETKESENSLVVQDIKHLLTHNEVFKESDIRNYIECVLFFNGGQDVTYSSTYISRDNLKLLNNIKNSGLLEEFIERGLMYLILEDALKEKYIYYVADINELTIKCSKELYDMLEQQIGAFQEETLAIIKNISKNIAETAPKSSIGQLKEIKNKDSFKELMANWNAQHERKKRAILIATRDIESLCNSQVYEDVRKKLILEIVNKSKEYEKMKEC